MRCRLTPASAQKTSRSPRRLERWCFGGLSDNNKETLNKSFDRLRTNGKLLIPFVVSLSNHERNPLIQRFHKSRQPSGTAEPVMNFGYPGCHSTKRGHR